MAASGGRRLRVERAVDATVLTLKNIPMILRLGLIPALIAVAISFAAIMALPVERAGESSGAGRASATMTWLPGILLLPAGALVMVGMHRFILRGERPGWVIARFGRYEVAFSAAAAIVLGVFWAIQAGISSVLDTISSDPDHFLLRTAVVVVVVATSIWLSLRLSLMPSHAAATGRVTPAVSWRAMAGNVLRGFVAWLAAGLGAGIAALVAALPSLLFTDVLFPVAQLPNENSRDLLLARLYETVAAAPAYGAMAAVYAAFLAYIYLDLAADAPPTAA